MSTRVQRHVQAGELWHLTEAQSTAEGPPATQQHRKGLWYYPAVHLTNNSTLALAAQCEEYCSCCSLCRIGHVDLKEESEVKNSRAVAAVKMQELQPLQLVLCSQMS